MLFQDRFDAGRELAKRLTHYAGRDDVIVLALPRGGVPVGYEVARALGAPLDVFLVRKLGMPGREEFAIGAIASGGVRVENPVAVQRHLRGGGAMRTARHFHRGRQRTIFGAAGARKLGDLVQMVLRLIAVALLELPQAVILPGLDVVRIGLQCALVPDLRKLVVTYLAIRIADQIGPIRMIVMAERP